MFLLCAVQALFLVLSVILKFEDFDGGTYTLGTDFSPACDKTMSGRELVVLCLTKSWVGWELGDVLIGNKVFNQRETLP